MPISETITKIEAAQSDMEAAQALYSSETDPVRKEARRGEWQAKCDVRKRLSEDLAIERSVEAGRDELDRVKADNTPAVIPHGLSAVGESKDAEGRALTGAKSASAEVMTDYESERNASHTDIRQAGLFLTALCHGGSGREGKAHIERTFGAKSLALIEPSKREGLDTMAAPLKVPRIYARHILGAKADAYQSLPLQAFAAAGITTDSGGRNLYPPSYWMPEIQEEPIWFPNIVGRVRRLPAAQGTVLVPFLDQDKGGPFGGVQGQWLANTTALENATFPQTNLGFTEKSFQTNAHVFYTALSNVILRRSPLMVEAYVVNKLRNYIQYELTRQILFGGGSAANTFTGIYNETHGAADKSINQVQDVARQAAGAVGYKDINALTYAVRKGLRPGGTYMLCDDAENALQSAVDNFGRPLFATSAASAIAETFNGRPWDSNELMDNTGASLSSLGSRGDILFGNFGYYGLGVEQELTLDRSEHALFLQNAIAIRGIMFAFGKCLIPRAFALLDAATAAKKAA